MNQRRNTFGIANKSKKTLESPVIQCKPTGEFLRSWSSIREASQALGIVPTVIFHAINSYNIKSWKSISDDKHIPDEIWKKYNTATVETSNFEVSNYGRIKTSRGVHYGTPHNKSGKYYVQVINLKTGKFYTAFVCTLVCELFVKRNNPKDIYVNFIDNDIKNSRADNLRWSRTRIYNKTKNYSKRRISKKGYFQKSTIDVRKSSMKIFNMINPEELKKFNEINSDDDEDVVLTEDEGEVQPVHFSSTSSSPSIDLNSEVGDEDKNDDKINHLLRRIGIVNLYNGEEIMKINVRCIPVGNYFKELVESAEIH